VFALPLLFALACPLAQAPERPAPFGIQVVDAATGRGVPLVELRTVEGLHYVTDSAGWVAFDEPGLLGETNWFFVTSHGYRIEPDGFGYRGVRLDTVPGGRARVEIERVNLAERLYRVTGQGIYRDSLLLGEPVPIEAAALNGGVLGQDSVVPVVFGGRILWFWGDTDRAAYPLGLFEVAGAWSELPDAGGLDPAVGVDLHYFTGKDGFARAMCPIDGPGPVWIFGQMVLDVDGTETLFTHYDRRKSLGERYEHGLARWDPAAETFEKWCEFEVDSRLHPSGQTIRVEDRGKTWFVFPSPYPHLRVEATLAAVGDSAQYQGYTCLRPGAALDPDRDPVQRDAEGRVVWGWKTNTAPLDETREDELVRRGYLSDAERLTRLRDVETGQRVRAHTGSIRWNPYRGKWVWILCETSGRSMLGETWYAEAPDLLGPWSKAQRIVSHDDYSFYNVAQHDFFAGENGRYVYFEGTYTRMFSGAGTGTERYDYNQILYRLDLANAGLAAAQQ